MHAPPEQPLELGPRRGADALDLAAAFAEDDGLLTGALHVDCLRDLDAAIVVLFPALGLDRRGIGQLLVQLEGKLARA